MAECICHKGHLCTKIGCGLYHHTACPVHKDYHRWIAPSPPVAEGELLPCPFDGSKAFISYDGDEGAEEWSANCPDCSATIEGLPTEQAAVEAWNRRTPAPVAQSPWCDACESYHPTPRDAAHKAELRCMATSEAHGDVSAAVHRAAEKIVSWVENSSDEELGQRETADESKAIFIAKAAAIIKSELYPTQEDAR